MDQIGVFSPEQARLLWQDYQTRQQLKPEIRYNFPQRKPIEDVSPHRVKVLNTSEEIIPSFGCMRVVGVQDVGGNTCVKVEKPSSTEGEFLFNSCYPIAVAGESELGVGWAYRHGVVTMLGDEPTASGALYQPIVDSWEIEEGGSKFVVFGRHDVSDRALTGRFNAGASVGDFIAFRPQDVCAGIGFTCDCVEAEVVEVVCGSSTGVGDIVNVWDRNRTKFNMPPELLYNSIGYARYVKVTEEEAEELPEDIGPCRWSVIIMDCAEEA